MNQNLKVKMICKEDYLNSLSVEKAREILKEEVKGYDVVAIPYFLKEQNLLLDTIDYLQKENEALKEKLRKPATDAWQ